MLQENSDTLHDMSGLLPCPGQLCGRGVASTLEHVLGHEVEDGGHHVVGKQVVKNLCLHGLVEPGGRKITHLRIARTKLDAAQERERDSSGTQIPPPSANAEDGASGWACGSHITAA